MVPHGKIGLLLKIALRAHTLLCVPPLSTKWWYRRLYKLETPLPPTRPSGPSVASRRRAAHARWPTSALTVGRDPLGALMAPSVGAAASAAMVVSTVLAASGDNER